VRFKDGRANVSYENFVTGFWVSGRDASDDVECAGLGFSSSAPTKRVERGGLY
jgi:hypothetical protein